MWAPVGETTCAAIMNKTIFGIKWASMPDPQGFLSMVEIWLDSRLYLIADCCPLERNCCFLHEMSISSWQDSSLTVGWLTISGAETLRSRGFDKRYALLFQSWPLQLTTSFETEKISTRWLEEILIQPLACTTDAVWPHKEIWPRDTSTVNICAAVGTFLERRQSGPWILWCSIP